MKKLFFMITAIFFMAKNTYAFIPETRVFINREVAVVRVLNTSFLPIICNGLAYSRTVNGVVLNAWMNQAYIYPNSFAEVYVYTNFYDPIIQAWAQVDCQQFRDIYSP